MNRIPRDTAADSEPHGRPAKPAKSARAKLSKEFIIDAAFELLRNDPSEGLTFERIAAAIGASPMSLYVHVGTKEVLLDEVANRALSKFDPKIDRAAPWQSQLCWCLEAAFEMVRDVPAQILLRLNSGALIGWAPVVAEIGRSLGGADLDDAEQARAMRWVVRSLLPMSISEALFPNPLLFFGLGGSLDRIPENDRDIVVSILPHMVAHEDAAKRAAFLARRIVDGVEGYVRELRALEAGATPLRPRRALNGTA